MKQETSTSITQDNFYSPKFLTLLTDNKTLDLKNEKNSENNQKIITKNTLNDLLPSRSIKMGTSTNVLSNKLKGIKIQKLKNIQKASISSGSTDFYTTNIELESNFHSEDKYRNRYTQNAEYIKNKDIFIFNKNDINNTEYSPDRCKLYDMKKFNKKRSLLTTLFKTTSFKNHHHNFEEEKNKNLKKNLRNQDKLSLDIKSTFKVYNNK
ncbi:MAG: hypothetical protein MJ252_22490, partial [archaeon]|nr:hypothetical protein [archaeon]